ncbi:MAG: thioredoxin domain-containing protein, partial [Bradymonadaceae bacterium]
VDREERPDIDSIYMDAVQMMTGQGGWPMSVWLDAELRPFYAGTYFPPEDRWGRAGFMRVLKELHRIWDDERERVDELAGTLKERMEMAAIPLLDGEGPEALDLDPVKAAFERFHRSFDTVDGGFGDAPKFPASMQCRLLFAVSRDEAWPQTMRDRAFIMAEKTLVRMASGGMYDHLGGGFHRYSVDRHWLIPHFEKMLYDNALLTKAYVEAFQITGRPFFRRIVQETLDYVLREMVFDEDPQQAPFYSTQDADSEGEEGKFFVWSPDELVEILGESDARVAADYWGVDEEGNFEHGRSALHRIHALNRHGDDIAFEPIPGELLAIRKTLLAAREKRIKPATDTKILAGWNGLMIGAMARAGSALSEARFIDGARSAAHFVTEEMVRGDWQEDFELIRTFKDGRARFSGYLDDYAYLATGLLDLFEATLETEWLHKSTRLIERALELFAHDDGGFYFTAPHHKDLLVRQMDSFDGATPSANAVAIEALLRLSALTGRDDLRDFAHDSLTALYPAMVQQPQAMTQMLQNLHLHIEGTPELLVIYPPATKVHDLAILRRHYVPGAARIFVEADEDGQAPEALREVVPWLEGKSVREDRPTIYLCREGMCEAPVFGF